MLLCAELAVPSRAGSDVKRQPRVYVAACESPLPDLTLRWLAIALPATVLARLKTIDGESKRNLAKTTQSATLWVQRLLSISHKMLIV